MDLPNELQRAVKEGHPVQWPWTTFCPRWLWAFVTSLKAKNELTNETIKLIGTDVERQEQLDQLNQEYWASQESTPTA